MQETRNAKLRANARIERRDEARSTAMTPDKKKALLEGLLKTTGAARMSEDEIRAKYSGISKEEIKELKRKVKSDGFEPDARNIVAFHIAEAAEWATIPGFIEKSAGKNIAFLEAKMKSMMDEAKLERDNSLKRLSRERKQSIESLLLTKYSNLDDAKKKTDEAKAGLQKQFEMSKKNLNDQRGLEEAEGILVAGIKAEDENLQRMEHEIEMEYVKDTKVKDEEFVSKEKEAQKNYLAKLMPLREVFNQIKGAKQLKREMLDCAGSSNTAESVDLDSIAKAFFIEPDANTEEPEKVPAVSEPVKKLAYVAGLFFVLHYGLSPHHRTANFGVAPQNVSAVTAKGAKPFVPLARTGMSVASTRAAHSKRTSSSTKSKAQGIIRPIVKAPAVPIALPKKIAQYVARLSRSIKSITNLKYAKTLYSKAANYFRSLATFLAVHKLAKRSQ